MSTEMTTTSTTTTTTTTATISTTTTSSLFKNDNNNNNNKDKMKQNYDKVVIFYNSTTNDSTSSLSLSTTTTTTFTTTSLPRVVHFEEHKNDNDDDDNDDNEYSLINKSQENNTNIQQKQENNQNEKTQQQQLSTNYSSSMYLSPQESPFQLLSRSSPNSPIGSNVSIVGSFMYNHELNGRKTSNYNDNGKSSTNWRLRAKNYSKRRGQERSIDLERQPSICSDSETDSINGQQKIEDIMKSCGNTTKKWSLPLPMVIRSSESDSASSSWSARSADEATEDERSPVPSPSASTHSNDEYLSTIGESESIPLQSPTKLNTSKKLFEIETEKQLSLMKINKNERKKNLPSTATTITTTTKTTTTSTSSTSSLINTSTMSSQDSFESNKYRKDKGKLRRKKKMSRAAESHSFQRMKTTNYGRCIICDAYVYFWGYECTKCQLICHKKCLKKMAIVCPEGPLPPRLLILNLELDSLSSDQMVPLLVQKCTLEIERRALTRPGIYRMTGVATRVEKLLKSFESGPHLIDLTDVSINDLTSVLKVFLRELKIPLINNDVYKEFLDLGRTYRNDNDLYDIDNNNNNKNDNNDNNNNNDNNQINKNVKKIFYKKISTIINKLSKNHYETLKYMIKHLKLISDYQEQNNMSPASLGIIFAPTFFRPRDTINDLHTEIFEAAPQARIIELMIRFYQEIFESKNDHNTDDDDNDNDNSQNENLLIIQQQQQDKTITTTSITTLPSTSSITNDDDDNIENFNNDNNEENINKQKFNDNSLIL